MIPASTIISVGDLFQVDDKYYFCGRISEDETEVQGTELYTYKVEWFQYKYISAVWKPSMMTINKQR